MKPKRLALAYLAAHAAVMFLLHTAARTETDKQEVIRTWPSSVYAPFKKTEKKQILFGTSLYRIDSATMHGRYPHPIDSFMALKILKYQNILPSSTYIYNRTLTHNDYYSIDKPVNGFYPVTLIGHEKEGMRNLTMYLMDQKGRIKNCLYLGFRGTMRRMRISPLSAGNDSGIVYSEPVFTQSFSERKNDSTFYFRTERPEIKFDSTVPRRVTYFADKLIIVHKNGTVETLVTPFARIVSAKVLASMDSASSVES